MLYALFDRVLRRHTMAQGAVVNLHHDLEDRFQALLCFVRARRTGAEFGQCPLLLVGGAVLAESRVLQKPFGPVRRAEA